MFINISNLTTGQIQNFTFNKTFESPKGFGLTVDNIAVIADGKISVDAGIYTINAKISTTVNLECCLCLKPAIKEIEFEITEEFSKTDTLPSDEIWCFEGHIIDISECVFTNLITNIPAKVLCFEDCKGLCHECGINLNTSSCNCNNIPKDSVFSTLYSFFEDEEV